MDRDNAPGQVLVAHAPPTGRVHERGQRLLVGPGDDGLAEVGVGLGIGGDQSPDRGQRRAQL